MSKKTLVLSSCLFCNLHLRLRYWRTLVNFYSGLFSMKLFFSQSHPAQFAQGLYLRDALLKKILLKFLKRDFLNLLTFEEMIRYENMYAYRNRIQITFGLIKYRKTSHKLQAYVTCLLSSLLKVNWLEQFNYMFFRKLCKRNYNTKVL